MSDVPRAPWTPGNYRLHNKAVIEGTAPLTVTLPPPAWSYAIEFPRHPDVTWTHRPALISVRLRVEHGAVGVGIVTPDGRTYVDETVCHARGEAQEAPLFVPEPDDCGSLIIRNVAEETGRAAILAIRAAPAPALAAGTTPPRLLAPMPNWSKKYYGNCFDRYDDKVRAWEFDNLTRSTVLPWLDDLRLIIHPGAEMCRAVYVSGVYEPNTMVVLSRLLKPGDVFLDVGAGMGFFTLFAARRVERGGRVYAFEPSRRDRERLAANVRLNRLDNVHIRPEAVADREGSAELLVAEERHSGHNTISGRFAYAGTRSVARDTVPTTTLDGFAAEQRLERVDVIKMDIEGSEYRALRGAEQVLDRWRPALILEVSPVDAVNGNDLRDMETLLSRKGYAFFEIDEAGARLVPAQTLAMPDSTNMVCLPSPGLRK